MKQRSYKNGSNVGDWATPDHILEEYSNASFIRRMENHKVRLEKKKFSVTNYVDRRQLTLREVEKLPSYHRLSEEKQKKLRASLLSRRLNEFI